MGGWQRIVNKHNKILASDYIASEYWSDNVPALAESLVFVNLMYFIYNIVKNMTRGLITIYTDQRRVQKFIRNEIKNIRVHTSGVIIKL